MIILQFNNLPCEINLSESVRPKYYERKSKIPSRIRSKIGMFYDWSSDGYLYDVATKEFLIANANQAGKPNKLTVNGNLVWQPARTMQEAYIKTANIGKIKRSLVEYFICELEKLPKVCITYFPVKIGFEFTTINDNIDADNMELFYKKSFLDAIQYKKWISQGVMGDNPVGFLPEDNRKYVKGFLQTDFELGLTNSLKITILDGSEILLANKPQLV